MTDDQAILISKIFPTGWYGAVLAEVKAGDTVAVFGCGPVGLFAVASAFLQGAGRVIAIDKYEDRLAMARRLGAFTVNFEAEDPTKTVKELTGGVGVDRVTDAVGVDAMHAHGGPAAATGETLQKHEQQQGRTRVAPARRRLHPGRRAEPGAGMGGGMHRRPARWASSACARPSGCRRTSGRLPS